MTQFKKNKKTKSNNKKRDQQLQQQEEWNTQFTYKRAASSFPRLTPTRAQAYQLINGRKYTINIQRWRQPKCLTKHCEQIVKQIKNILI